MEVERAVLVGAGENRHMRELERLVDTLGVQVAGRLEQNRRDNAAYVGRGKREELAGLVGELEADLVITDDELTASQARNLERVAGASVVDRTELIIRIFESHASDRASRLEVEFAELEYRLPRVKGRRTALGRIGGVGASARGAARGPGEQQLEYDRRMIRERMDVLRRKLEEERSAREVRSARRRESGPPKVALVGYTNAGKTTILNALSGAGRSTKDRLFETLETTTRRIPGGTETGQGGPDDRSVADIAEARRNGHADTVRPDFVVTDTVGFIRKLPTQLVHSFASTLEAARDADVIVLCADSSSEELHDEIRTVRRTLSDYLEPGEGAAGEAEEPEPRVVLCLNKGDLIQGNTIKELMEEYPEAVVISAYHDVAPLLDRVYATISRTRRRMSILIPHEEYGKAANLYGLAEIHGSESTFEGTLMDVTLPDAIAGEYAHFRVA
jgi:GTP-binding protein HflX